MLRRRSTRVLAAPVAERLSDTPRLYASSFGVRAARLHRLTQNSGGVQRRLRFASRCRLWEDATPGAELRIEPPPRRTALESRARRTGVPRCRTPGLRT